MQGEKDIPTTILGFYILYVKGWGVNMHKDVAREAREAGNGLTFYLG